MQFVSADPKIFRLNISKHLGKILSDEAIGKNVEISIYNYAIQESHFRQIIKKWSNIKFAEIYDGRLRSILYNLKTNPEFLVQIKEKQITPKSLASMTHQEINPDKWKNQIEKKIQRDKSRLSTNIEASTDLFMCRKCKSKRCTYYEMQTRSADEPATIFITCLDCGKNWKN